MMDITLDLLILHSLTAASCSMKGAIRIFGTMRECVLNKSFTSSVPFISLLIRNV